MELSARRQTWNMRAFILTMAVVYVPTMCEFANLTDMFIGSLCLLMLSFHVMIALFLFLFFCYAFTQKLILLIFIIMTLQLISWI